ncbi:MAG: glycoside hydrolase, partial [Prolixibacteraceae bacterium]
IHFDLTLANARSWQWWTALSQYDYKDGLIFLDNGNNGINGPGHPDAETLKTDGFVRESKLLWALGNYSRFVRPGMVRVKAGFTLPKTEEEQAKNLMFSAYKDRSNKELVLVFVNYSVKEKKLTIGNLDKGIKLAETIAEAYTTSENSSLQKSVIEIDKIAVPARSVMTLCLKLQ